MDMKRALRITSFITLTLVAGQSQADWFKTTIKAVHTRTNGNIAFKTNDSAPNSTCTAKDSWEIHNTDANFNQNTSILLTALTTKSVVYLHLDYAALSCESWGHGIVNQIMIGDWFQ